MKPAQGMIPGRDQIRGTGDDASRRLWELTTAHSHRQIRGPTPGHPRPPRRVDCPSGTGAPHRWTGHPYRLPARGCLGPAARLLVVLAYRHGVGGGSRPAPASTACHCGRLTGRCGLHLPLEKAPLAVLGRCGCLGILDHYPRVSTSRGHPCPHPPLSGGRGQRHESAGWDERPGRGHFGTDRPWAGTTRSLS